MGLQEAKKLIQGRKTGRYRLSRKAKTVRCLRSGCSRACNGHSRDQTGEETEVFFPRLGQEERGI